MKNIYPLQSKTVYALVFLFFTFVLSAQTPEEKQALKVAQAKAALDRAKENVVKAERKVFISDSLTDIGIRNSMEVKEVYKQLEEDLKAKDQEYYANVKAINKRLKSKDEAERLKAQKDLKDEDAKMKAFLKENDTKAKATIKKDTKAKADKDKGKTSKKAAEEGLAKAQAALDVAQAKYDMATNTTSSSSSSAVKKEDKKEDKKVKEKKEKDKEEEQVSEEPKDKKEKKEKKSKKDKEEEVE